METSTGHRISEVAARVGFSASAMRFYDAVGLVASTAASHGSELVTPPFATFLQGGDEPVDADFGRMILGADGGIVVTGSLGWGMAVDGFRPDRYDLIGAGTCLVGVAVIMFAPPPSGATDATGLRAGAQAVKALLDLVADEADGVDALAGGVFEVPVLGPCGTLCNRVVSRSEAPRLWVGHPMAPSLHQTRAFTFRFGP